MQMGDEHDKHNIHMYALHDTQLQNEEIMNKTDNFAKLTSAIAIQLKDECISCNQDYNSKKRIFKSFKQACLNYKPSDVIFRG